MRTFHFLLCGALAVTLSLAPAGAQNKKKGGAKGGAPAGDVEHGKELFEQCGVCHNADNAEKKLGPGLKGLFKNAKMNNGKQPTEANVRAVIDEGGNGMPAYKEMLTDSDKNDVVAYLKTL